MKNAFILTILTLTIAACSPKNAVKNNMLGLVTKNFTEWVANTNSGDITKIMDSTYPKLFDLQPREQMEQMYGQMSMMGIKNLVKDAKISNLSNFVTSGGMKYAKAKMAATSVTEVPDASMVDLMFNQLKTVYGEDQITKNEKSVEVAMNDDLYIIQDEATDKMYFLQAGASMAPVLGQILPADVIEKLK